MLGYYAALAQVEAWVSEQASNQGEKVPLGSIPKLAPRQRKVLALLTRQDNLTTGEIAVLFQVSPRTARQLYLQCVEEGFQRVENPTHKACRFGLAKRWQT